MEKIRITLVGATGLVGQDILALLNEELRERVEITAVASDDSVGEYYQFGDADLTIEKAQESAFIDRHLVIFATPKAVTEKLLPEARKHAPVLEVVGQYQESDARVWWPGNQGGVQKGEVVILPSVAAQLVSPFVKCGTLSGLALTSFHSVSGLGRAGLDELWEETRGIFNQQEVTREVFEQRIAFNVIPNIDAIKNSGSSAAEELLVQEISQLSKLPPEDILVTLTRVPLFHGVALSIQATYKDTPLREKILGVEFRDDEPATPADIAENDAITVSRLRIGKHTLQAWVLADNIRLLARGAVSVIAAAGSLSH